MLQLIAEQLELLEADTSQFQKYFSEGRSGYKSINSNSTKKNNERLQLLVQQILIGLPVEPMLQNYPQLANWIEQLRVFIDLPFSKKLLNAAYKIPINNVFISANYNLILAKDNKAIAVNWSTTKYVQSLETLRASWETQLSLFILAEVEQVPPEDVYITYLFLTDKSLPNVYQFSYSQLQHDYFRERLEKALIKLVSWVSTDEVELNKVDEIEQNLQQLLNGQLSIREYINTIPEVEI